MQKLTDASIKLLPRPASGNKIAYDSEVKGFGVRVTAAGARAFILNYRTRAGRERRYTIGSFPDWKTSPARAHAADLKRRVDMGFDPMAEVDADRVAKTMADLCERFEDDYLPNKREATARDYKALIRREIRPALQYKRVDQVDYSDIEALHRKITRRGATYLADRTVAVLSKMFSLAIKWKWRSDNPAKGIERNHETKRSRYLSPAEIVKLTSAFTELDDRQAANIFRLLLLTGARRGEVQAARWADLNLTEGVWTKPGSTTKQKTEHRVPLSAPARQMLSLLQAAAEPDAEYVFPGRSGGHRVEIKTAWKRACVNAGVTPVRIHDLRHTYASMLASAGTSLPIIGALLGHTQPATTARYSHLLDDPLRQATERVGAIVLSRGEGGLVAQLRSSGER